MDNENLKRIADALEEILRLVKKDLEPKVRENPESIQTKWVEELKAQWF